MAREWTTIPAHDVRAFLSRQGNKSVGVHALKPLRPLHWPVCSRCGLIALKNERTRKALKAACVVWE
jgi:hypothetical protein